MTRYEPHQLHDGSWSCNAYESDGAQRHVVHVDWTRHATRWEAEYHCRASFAELEVERLRAKLAEREGKIGYLLDALAVYEPDRGG